MNCGAGANPTLVRQLNSFLQRACDLLTYMLPDGQRIGEAREVLRTVGEAHLIQLTHKVTSLEHKPEEFGCPHKVSPKSL